MPGIRRDSELALLLATQAKLPADPLDAMNAYRDPVIGQVGRICPGNPISIRAVLSGRVVASNAKSDGCDDGKIGSKWRSALGSGGRPVAVEWFITARVRAASCGELLATRPVAAEART